MSKVAIVTGASSGIGRALAFELSKQGYSVCGAARPSDQLDSLTADLAKESGEHITVPTDVTREEACENLVNSAVDRFGRVDVLINNAGISMRALFKNTEVDVLKRVMDVNFWGTVYCTKFALPHLLKQKGSVVGVSSIAGYRGLPGRTGYSASKFAMQGFLEALRTEHLKDGLHVLTACPGFTASNIRKKALNNTGDQQGESPRAETKMMTAEEVAKHILKAIENRKKLLTLTSQGKMTVFLNKWLPGWMDKMVYNHMAKEQDSPFK